MKTISIKFFRKMLLVSIFLLGFGLLTNAQPSGGPYGPISQKYELPKVKGNIWYVAPDGKAENEGAQLSAPTSIEAAFKKVKSGDAIVLRGGTYRTGNLLLNQGITMQPFNDEQVVLKGTYEVTQWVTLGRGLWMCEWEHLFPMEPADWWVYHNAGRQTPMHRFNNDMVFADGRFLQSAGWLGEVDENHYFIDYENNRIYIGVDPNAHLMEVTAFDVAIHRVDGPLNGVESDKIGPIIKGITFTQYAYRAFEFDGTNPEGVSPRHEHGQRVKGTTLENVTISFCSRVGGYFRGDNFTMRNCLVTDTSTEGVFILSSSDVLLERNIFTRNNIEKITGYFPAAVKIFNQCYDVVCNDNLVTDLEDSNGIWYDVGNVDGIFTNNRLQNVGRLYKSQNQERAWSSDNAFFFEISKGVTVAGNEFINCDQAILILNASDAKIYQNTIINSGVSINRTSRSAQGDHFGWHPASGPDVDERHGHVFVNNLVVGTATHPRLLINITQGRELCSRLKDNPVEDMDGNVFVYNTGLNRDIIGWSPIADEEYCSKSFKNIAALREALPGMNKNSREWNYGSIALFKGEQTGNYELLPSFPGHNNAITLPAEVQKILKLTKRQKPYVGAHPVK